MVREGSQAYTGGSRRTCMLLATRGVFAPKLGVPMQWEVIKTTRPFHRCARWCSLNLTILTR